MSCQELDIFPSPNAVCVRVLQTLTFESVMCRFLRGFFSFYYLKGFLCLFVCVIVVCLVSFLFLSDVCLFVDVCIYTYRISVYLAACSIFSCLSVVFLSVSACRFSYYLSVVFLSICLPLVSLPANL